MTKARVRLNLLLAWATLLLLWLVFAGSTSAPEVLVGALAAALGAYAMRRVELREIVRVAPLPRGFAQAWRLPWIVLTGTGEMLAVLARQLFAGVPAPSLLFETPYAADADDGHDATMRALATTYTSISPNFVVIDIDREQGLLMFHQIAESETPELTIRLGAHA
jgi:multisubunit Na+/H+ antiporter MnhE subunit